MKKIFLIIMTLIILSSIVGAILLFNSIPFNLKQNKCNLETVRETPVSLSLAKSVAIEQVHRNNPPFNWTYVGNYLVYNSFGESNYYLLIFRKDNFTALDTLEELEQNAKLFSDSTDEYNQLNDEQRQFNTEQKYQTENIATVMTGTMKEDKLIQRHYRGIPEAIAKKLEIEEMEGSLGNLILDSPGSSFYYEIGGGNVIRILDFSITPHSELKDIQKNIQKRKDQTSSNLGREECRILQTAYLEMEKVNMAEWNAFE